jgi:hypothetical protein
MGTVGRITHQVELVVAAQDLETWAFQQWVLDNVIGKIPGSGHAPE